ncbi:MAG: ABC transporter ATP-binding protein, partial [Clostridiales bacterium]|nr:ABC transporter ATP-binding protein [Clostridiales bacterium]
MKQPKKTDMRTLRRVLKAIRPYSPFLVLSLLLAAFTVALTLYFPILTGQAIDLAVGKGNVDKAGIFGLLAKMAVIVGLTALFQWLLSLSNNRIAYSTVRDIRNAAFKRLQTLPLSYLDAHPHGELVSRVIADADQFSEGLLMGFTQLFTGVITILGTLGFMFSLNWRIALVVVVVTPVSLFVASFIANRTYSMFRLQSETRGEQTALLEEMVGNQKVVQSFGQEEKVLARFDNVNERLRSASLRAIFFSSITNPSTRFVNSLVYAAVGITGAFSAIAGSITVGGLSCFLSYANQYTKPFNEISGVVTELQNALACAERVFALIDAPAETPDAADAAVLSDPKGDIAME